MVRGDRIERGGVVPHWRAVLDDEDRPLVAICFNMGGSPRVPEKYSIMAFRMGVNYVMCALTH